MRTIPDKYRIYFIYLVLAILARAVFWQVHSFDFVNYDDSDYVGNEHISSGVTWDNCRWVFTHEHMGNWHPLTGLSHMLDCQLFDLKPALHHLANLLFHIANTLLLFAVLRRMTATTWQSAFVAALFALHPLHVESVAWISERKDVLSTFFGILTIAAYLRYVKIPKAGSYILMLILFTMCLMSKPMLVTLPFVLLLLDYWPLNRMELKNSSEIFRLVIEKIPLFVLSDVSSVVTYLVQKSASAVQTVTILPMSVRAANAVVSYGKYILMMVWPAHLAVFYPYPEGPPPYWQVLGAAVLLVIITVFIIRFARKYRYLPVGWFWYLGTLVPVIGLIQAGDQAMADRYTYVPLIGLFIIIAWGANDLLSKYSFRKIILSVSSVIVISVLSVCAFFQTGYWRNSQSLFEHALKVTTGNYVAYNGLGLACLEQHKFEQAVSLLHHALQLNPDSVTAYNNLGNAYGSLGRYREAIEAYKQAIRIKSNYAEAYYNLGVTYSLSGDKNAAMEQYKILKILAPEAAEQLSELIHKETSLKTE